MGIASCATALRVKEKKQINFHGNHKDLLLLRSDAHPLLRSDAHPLLINYMNKAFNDSISSYKPRDVDNMFEFEDEGEGEEEKEEKVVCVTSAASYLGVAIVKQLLAKGYSVCALLDKQDDEEKLREVGIIRGEEGGKERQRVEMKWVSLTENDGLGERSSLYDAFNGCHGVFHTSSFIDPSGLSGYSKPMAELELKAAANVIKTCARVSSITKCVLTSSLASCIWQDESHTRVIDHNSWSQESTCIDKKLWFALGKLRAEKEAWRVAQESDLKLATLCPALITGPDYPHKNSTPTNAYLKGCGEMYAKGILATIDVTRLAKAHVSVYEAMNENGGGRFICYDRVIRSEGEAQRISEETGVIIYNDGVNNRMQYQLSNVKMNKILLSTSSGCYTG